MDFSSLVSQSFDISATCNNFSSSPTELWHYRLGHPSYAKIHTLKDDLNISHISETPSHCSICHLAKQRRFPFMSSNNLSNSPFQLIHIDVWGPFHTITTEGYRYFFTIVDDCTRFTWVYFLRAKSEVSAVFPNFFTLIQTQFNVKIKSVRSDNAPELTFSDLFRAQGILSFHSCIETPQ